MKTTIRLVAISACFIFVYANAQQPSWNEAQLEIWALIEQSWVDDVARNGKWPADYVHNNYVSWGDNLAAPRYRDSAIAWGKFAGESSNTLMYEISPAAIVVENDTAVVHYYATTVTENSSGQRNRNVSRIMETLIREGRGWKWLASVSYEPNLND